MNWYQWMSIIALIICVGSLGWQFLRLLKLGLPKDYSSKIGNTNSGIKYAFTAAMNPKKKESAYLHLPTYTAGILYHLGTFLSIFLFFFFLAGSGFHETIRNIIFIYLIISGSCGIGIFIKRLINKGLRLFSNPDDYISNILVTLFHFLTAISLWFNSMIWVYFILTSLLLLYIPISKLKHVLYFFAARYHLGFFYGWRGVWPPKKV